MIRVAREDKGRWGIVADAAGRSRRSSRCGPPTARSCRSSADSTSTAASSTTSRRRSASPGSSFKPFIYSAALEKGFTPATIVNDAPFFVPADKAGGEAWEPKNYDGKFDGPMRVRTALAKSKNLVTVRVMQAIGATLRAGLHRALRLRPEAASAVPAAWRSAPASATPLQMVAAYSVFANGGYRVAPYLITRVVDARGNVLSEAQPTVAGENAERAIDPRNALIMTSLLKDVIAYGTGDPRACRSAARTSPARPARPTRTSTPGSAATTRRWSASRGSASTSRRRSGNNETGARGRAADLDRVHGEGPEGHAASRRCRCPTASSR